ncbi:hypothetical protein BU23DRAFT_556713 [Bimuria novae-zelandiae CBS 107.79]|uniref:Uncharacterized protein n=1 Tax=Bimuria novae-zelandiae CBS 107.79 TaxID=1447943 RepID=A0A6A5V093_9PLEO|nr:hypothetical protein BU23DRAFT_556713 [Bimuria novae-zelandiae CBS 107.79]
MHSLHTHLQTLHLLFPIHELNPTPSRPSYANTTTSPPHPTTLPKQTLHLNPVPTVSPKPPHRSYKLSTDPPPASCMRPNPNPDTSALSIYPPTHQSGQPNAVKTCLAYAQRMPSAA